MKLFNLGRNLASKNRHILCFFALFINEILLNKIDHSDIENTERPERKPFMKTAFSWVAIFFIVVICLFFVLYFSLKIPSVQNRVADYTMEYLSKELKTKVSLDHISLSFFDNIILDGFYIEDLRGDTLLYSKKLTANLNSGPWAWINRTVILQDVELEGAKLRMVKQPEEEYSNLQFLIDKLKPKGNGNRPFIFNMENLSLIDLQATYDNIRKGERQDFILRDGTIEVKNIDLKKNEFVLDDVKLNEPFFQIKRFEKDAARYVTFPEKEKEESEPNDTLKKEKTPLHVTLERLVVKDAIFKFEDERSYPQRKLPANSFDDRSWIASDIYMEQEQLDLLGSDFSSKIVAMQFKEKSGFEVKKLTSEEFKFTDTKITLNGFGMKTPKSFLGDTISFKFSELSDFNRFNNLVYINAKLNNSAFAFEDILTFFPKLANNKFFTKNKKELLNIDGELKGKINSLKGFDMNFEIGSGFKFRGDFRSKNLAVKDQEFIDLDITRLRTNTKTLYELIPRFNPPENFKKLGQLDFKGDFTGYYYDFVAFGDLRTDLGRAVMDMTLKINEGRETALYSGNINLQSFDLGKWTGNSDLGIVSLKTRVKDGVGLTGASANAALIGTIESFVYKNYNYQNIAINGDLNNRRFNGKLEIADNNIDLNFLGDINYRNDVPVFDFKSKISKLNLKALNLSQKDLRVSGDIDLNLVNSNLSDMEGEIEIFNLVFENGTQKFLADSIMLSSSFQSDGEKLFKITSNVLNGKIKGDFDIEQIPNTFLAYYHRNFPTFMKKFGIKKPKNDYREADFEFDFTIDDAREFAKIISPEVDSLKGVEFYGFMNTVKDEVNIEFEVPRLKYKNWDFTGLAAQTNLEQSNGHLNFAAGKTVRGKREFSPVIVFGLMERDTYEFGLTHTADIQAIEDINLDGKFFIKNDKYQVNFKPSSLVIGKREWDIPAQNYIRFGNNTIETKNFVLSNDDKKIVIESYNSNRGLKFDLQNFNLDFIEELWNYKPLDFSGNFSFSGAIEDIFNLRGINAKANAPLFKINDEDYGEMDLALKATDLKGVLSGNLEIIKGEQQLKVNGNYTFPNANKSAKLSDYWDIDAQLTKYPIKMLEYWVTGGIKNTTGTLSTNDLRIYGQPKALQISGEAFTENGRTTLTYLNTTYDILDGKMSINNKIFDATGSILRDDEGNTANVFGGITHKNIKQLGLDVRIKSDRFVVLNTDKTTKAPFYGRGVGRGDVSFSGNFKKTDIYVDATTGLGTQIKIPVISDNSKSELSFINFVDKNKIEFDNKKENGSVTDLKGINLIMKLSMTDDAEMFLIFDERAGDEIIGRGKGDIEMKVLRDGTFSMVGDYFIESGTYLFTMLNVVNKKFKVQKGGTIRWFGDPFGAEINLEAKYSGLSTPISNLIIEYLQLLSDDLKREAGKSTPIDLTMLLKGQLLKPDIKFDIDFPELSGELKTYAQSKLRVLKQDENELNRQVFGLVVTGQFLPSEFSFAVGNLAVSTLTELIANQLSIYLTDLFSDLIKEIDYFSGIDIDLAYNTYENSSLSSVGQDFGASGSTVQFNVNPYFLQNRLSINVGGEFNADDNVNFGTTNRAGTFSAGDFIVEYALTPSRRLKLRAYASYERVIDGGAKSKYGGGLSYRREFDSFEELFNGLKSGIRKEFK